MRKLIVCFLLSCVCSSICSSALAVSLPTPNKFGGDFSLDSTLDRPVKISEFKGKVVLLNFGYTSCPDVCPMVLSRMARLSRDINSPSELKVVFISFDKERDSIAHLKKYLTFFNKQFVGMNGDDEKIHKIMKTFGGVFQKDAETNKEIITFSHSDYIYLIDKQGYVAGFYGSDIPYETLLAEIKAKL